MWTDKRYAERRICVGVSLEAKVQWRRIRYLPGCMAAQHKLLFSDSTVRKGGKGLPRSLDGKGWLVGLNGARSHLSGIEFPRDKEKSRSCRTSMDLVVIIIKLTSAESS